MEDSILFSGFLSVGGYLRIENVQNALKSIPSFIITLERKENEQLPKRVAPQVPRLAESNRARSQLGN